MTPVILPETRFVTLDAIRQAIRRFELDKQNPHGMSKAIPGSQPVWLELRTGHPSTRKEDTYSIQLPLYTASCDDEQKALYSDGAGIQTRHAVLYPMTKAYVQRQWHRVYAYDVASGAVTEVRLLVAGSQDAAYAITGYKSAHEWTRSVERCGELVFDGELYQDEPGN